MKSRFLPLIGVLFVASVLIFAIDDFLHKIIVEPFLYILWFISYVLASFPQWAFWAILIIFALLAARKSLGRDNRPRLQALRPGAHPQGPVATWLVLLEQAETQDFFRWRLAQALSRARPGDLLVLLALTQRSAALSLIHEFIENGKEGHG